MSDDNKSPEDSSSSDFEDKAKSFFDKVVEAGNRKYGFNFEVHGWIIGIVSILLLILILK